MGQQSVAAVVLVGLASCYVCAVGHCLTGDSAVCVILIALGPAVQALAYQAHLSCSAGAVSTGYGLRPAGLCGALCCHTAKVIIIGDKCNSTAVYVLGLPAQGVIAVGGGAGIGVGHAYTVATVIKLEGPGGAVCHGFSDVAV